MLGLKRLTVVGSTISAYLDGVTDIEIVTVGGQVRLVTVSRGVPGVTAFTLAEGAGLQLTGQRSLSAALSTTAEPQLTFVPTSAGNALLTTGLATLAPYANWLTASGSFSTPGYWNDPGAGGVHLDETVLVQTTAGKFLFASRYDMSGLWSFGITASGATVTANPSPQINGVPVAVISDLAVLSGPGGPWLITALADQDWLVAYAVNPDGTIGTQQSIGAVDGLGISVPTALATVQLGQVEYLVLASAQSSTLTVFMFDPNGVLVAADNIVDSLLTRFACASHVDAIATHGRAFVVVAGSDDGISLFTILPGGRLLHLATFADGASSTLANVSSLALAVLGNELQLIVASASEPGLTQIAYDLSAIGLTVIASIAGGAFSGGLLDDLLVGDRGNDSLLGGAGDDILVDGFGHDTLVGGMGADIFIFSADGQTDVVLDFNPAEDRLDLSAFYMLYSVNELVITPTSWGAILEYEGERVEVHSWTSTTLLSSAFSNANVLNLMRTPDITDTTGARWIGTSSADTIYGNALNEAIFGYDGADLLLGMGGFDKLHGGAGEDWIDGGDDNDLIFGDDGNDIIIGGAGDDELFGGADNDRMFGGAGVDSICGELGDDTQFGNSQNDTLSGGVGDDFLFGGSENDLVSGDDGDDRLFGESGNDTLFGGVGRDTLFGGLGDDRIFGSEDDDLLLGQEGADWLEGGGGNDVLFGEGGSDVFVFSGTFGSDLILDFDTSLSGDHIDLVGVAGALDFIDLIANHTTELDGNVTFAFSNASSITLLGVGIAELDPSSFLF